VFVLESTCFGHETSVYLLLFLVVGLVGRIDHNDQFVGVVVVTVDVFCSCVFL
jgi:hypothetical protein